MTAGMTAEKRIRALIKAARSGKKQAPVSRTMRVFNVLDDIEEALGLGISQSLIAEQLDMTVRQFSQALYRARRRKREAPPQNSPQPPQSPTPTDADSPFGSGGNLGGLTPFSSNSEEN